MDFKLPEVGENITSGNVVSIFVSEGDTVSKDQDLLELETDKASLPIPSPCDGVIKKILIKEGDDVNIGAVVMKIEDSGGAAPAKKEKKEKAPAKSKEAVASKPPKAEPATATATLEPPKTTQNTKAVKDVPAAPSIRRLARELGIDITQVPGSGPGGRISKDDVKIFTKGVITSGAGVTAGAPAKKLPDFNKFGQVEREAMSKIRKVTAENLSYCWTTIPHVTQFGKADITDLEKLRKKHSTKDRGLTVSPFLMKVMASAMKTFPQFNASIDMQSQEIIYKKYFNIGVAVDTDRGLLVPVVRDVDQKSIFQLAEELSETAKKARDKKITLDDLQGGCMTLTNLGGIYGTSFTPIVNWPEVAILGVSRGGWEQVYENGQFIPRFKLPLSLSYDHRVIDGADGARFLKWVCEAIEQPFLMELEG